MPKGVYNRKNARQPKYCIDCDKPIDYRATRCLSCSSKGELNAMAGATGEKNPNWRGGINSTYYQRNRDKVRERHHRHYLSNIEGYATRNSAWRALKAGKFVEKVFFSKLYQRDNGLCQLCKAPLDKALTFPNPLSKSIDHILPLSKGGEHSYTNTQIAHLGCNAAKRDKVQNGIR